MLLQSSPQLNNESIAIFTLKVEKKPWDSANIINLFKGTQLESDRFNIWTSTNLIPKTLLFSCYSIYGPGNA